MGPDVFFRADHVGKSQGQRPEHKQKETQHVVRSAAARAEPHSGRPATEQSYVYRIISHITFQLDIRNALSPEILMFLKPGLTKPPSKEWILDNYEQVSAGPGHRSSDIAISDGGDRRSGRFLGHDLPGLES